MLVTSQLCLLRFGVNFASHMISLYVTSGVKSILKLYLSKSIVTDGKTTRSKVESID